MLIYMFFYFKNICSIAPSMSGAPNLRTTLHICTGVIFFVPICTIVACGACVQSVSMCPTLTTCGDTVALTGVISVRITTATASPGISLVATSFAIFSVHLHRCYRIRRCYLHRNCTGSCCDSDIHRYVRCRFRCPRATGCYLRNR